MIVSYSGPTAVAANLLAYLRDRLGIPGLDFTQEPVAVTSGWETFLYTFRLNGAAGLPEHFRRSLVLRLYSSEQGVPRLRHEFLVQHHVRTLDYPVAQPLLMEESEYPLGGPFLIMQEAPGVPFLDYMLAHPWRIIDGPGRMAAVHARLHRLPAAGFPTPAGPFWERHFEEMRWIIDTYDLDGLKPGLSWLAQHRPAPPRTPSIIHLDFHPLNLMFDGNDFTALLDWTESDVGDRHADIAATIVLFKSAPLPLTRVLDRLAVLPGRSMLRRGYVRAYRRLLPLDDGLLAYYTAWASFRRLCAWGRWLRAGPGSTGGKPSSARYLSPARVAFLRNYFQGFSAVPVYL